MSALLDRYDLDSERWRELCAMVEKHEDVARSVYIVAREWWAKNQALERALKRMAT